MTDGYAYARGTRNLVEIMNAAGVGLTLGESLLREDSPSRALSRIIAAASNTSDKKARWLLNHAMTKPLADLRAKLVQLQAYARPPDKG